MVILIESNSNGYEFIHKGNLPIEFNLCQDDLFICKQIMFHLCSDLVPLGTRNSVCTEYKMSPIRTVRVTMSQFSALFMFCVSHQALFE